MANAILIKSNPAGVMTAPGEVFNDYENNQALGKHSHAEGTDTHAMTNMSWSNEVLNYVSCVNNVLTLTSTTADFFKTNTVKAFRLEDSTGRIYHDIVMVTSQKEGANGWEFTISPTNGTVTVGDDDKILINALIESTSNNTCQHVEGQGNYALGTASHAEGIESIASGGCSHAEGEGCVAHGRASHAEGYNTKTTTGYNHAEGAHTVASGSISHAEGQNTIASGGQSHAEGHTTVASGAYSHAEGRGSIASAHYSHAEGNDTKAQGVYSHAQNFQTTASGSKSHAEGAVTLAAGDAAHAEGNNTKANAESSHAEGKSTVADKPCAHAEGFASQALGDTSHAEGYKTIASESFSHAEGGETKAQGTYSHAEGCNTTASGAMSHSEGYLTKAEGNYSHAQGKQTIAKGATSFVGGGGSTDAGFNTAFVFGQNLQASREGQVVLGAWNKPDPTALFILGGGWVEYNEDGSVRTSVKKNIFTVNVETDASGNNIYTAYLNGKKLVTE